MRALMYLILYCRDEKQACEDERVDSLLPQRCRLSGRLARLDYLLFNSQLTPPTTDSRRRGRATRQRKLTWFSEIPFQILLSFTKFTWLYPPRSVVLGTTVMPWSENIRRAYCCETIQREKQSRKTMTGGLTATVVTGNSEIRLFVGVLHGTVAVSFNVQDFLCRSEFKV